MHNFKAVIVSSLAVGSLAGPASAEVVYKASTLPSSIFAAALSTLQQGNEVVLAGSDRTVNLFRVAVTRQGNPGTADFQARFYANDGTDGKPSTLLWQSGILDDQAIGAGHEWIEFVVPNIVVPDRLTWTLQISDSKGSFDSAVGLSTNFNANDPTVGSFAKSWFGSPSPQTSTSTLHVAEIHAVPEPSALSLLALGGLVCARRRRGA